MTLQQVKQRFGIIGNAPMLNRALEVAIQVAPTDISVLVTGESGTGKEIIPQVIHNLSARKHKEYIAVNCGAIPEGTIDSELFGHEKGSFTSAFAQKKGKFELAEGGTLFLDEVGDMSLSAQAKVLRALQENKITRVGGVKEINVNVRIISATNKNLEKEIEQKLTDTNPIVKWSVKNQARMHLRNNHLKYKDYFRFRLKLPQYHARYRWRY